MYENMRWDWYADATVMLSLRLSCLSRYYIEGMKQVGYYAAQAITT